MLKIINTICTYLPSKYTVNDFVLQKIKGYIILIFGLILSSVIRKHLSSGSAVWTTFYMLSQFLFRVFWIAHSLHLKRTDLCFLQNKYKASICSFRRILMANFKTTSMKFLRLWEFICISSYQISGALLL